MIKKILLNGQGIHFTDKDLPILIHGKEQVGASLFTVSLLADLYNRGAKILFLSGYHMARDEFLEQVPSADYVIAQTTADLETLKQKQLIFVKGENPDLFIQLNQLLSDVEQRVILIKNIELFTSDVFNVVKDKNKIIISGDIDKCAYKNDISAKKYQTKIIFSQPRINLGISFSDLKKYEGFMQGQTKNGVVSVQIKP